MQFDDLKKAVLNYARANADHDGLALTSVPGLRMMIQESPHGDLHSIYRPLVCLVLQGKKSLVVGTQEATFTAGQSVIVSADMPVTGRIVQADRTAPYLAVAVELDAGMVKEIAAEIAPTCDVPVSQACTLFSVDTDDAALGCVARLLQLVDAPEAVPILHAGIMRELHYWLISGRHGSAIRALGLPDSHASRLGRAIAQLRTDYRQPMTSADLARTAGMGVTAFHRHFKAMTSLSPGQFRKRLRLIEARRLMMNEGCAAGHAAYQVGYKSVSQFTREYKLLFGSSPAKHATTPGD